MINVSIMEVNGGFILQNYAKEQDYDPERYVFVDLDSLLNHLKTLKDAK